MKETIRFHYYTRLHDVLCQAWVGRERIEAVGETQEQAREGMITKLKRELTKNADHVEDVEIEF